MVAIAQTDVKRMLAYSSIAHAGFLLVGFAGATQAGDEAGSPRCRRAVLPGRLRLHDDRRVRARHAGPRRRRRGHHLSRWAGLGQEAPLLAGAFALFLLAFAGIPLTSGFIGKWAVFTAAWPAAPGRWSWSRCVLSAVAAFFYVRVIVLMFFTDPVGDGPTVAVPSVLTTVVIAVGLRSPPWCSGRARARCSTWRSRPAPFVR